SGTARRLESLPQEHALLRPGQAVEADAERRVARTGQLLLLPGCAPPAGLNLPGVFRSRKARREAWLPALPFVPAVRQYDLSILRRWLPIARLRRAARSRRLSGDGVITP